MTTNGITTTPDRNSAQAPGKLILSGEHAVVYGAPALAVALDRYTEVWFTPILGSKGLRTAFDNLSQGQFYPIELLKSFKQGLDRRFDAFTRGDLTVQKILKRPDDLAVYTMALLLNYVPVPGVTSTKRLPMPGLLSSKSDLPLGAGMGSSAAIIAATFVLYEHLLKYSQSDQERFERVRFCERLQHGNGSAIDAATVVYGGMNRIDNGELSHLKLKEDHSLLRGDGWYWVLHGKPDAPTGECVAKVRDNHGDDTILWDAFTECTNTLQIAIEEMRDPREIIKENNALLQKIGVVPTAAKGFVAEVERAGGAAKVSGAGSVRGDKAGTILVHMPEDAAMERLMSKHPDLRWERLRITPQGVHLNIREPLSEPIPEDVTVAT